MNIPQPKTLISPTGRRFMRRAALFTASLLIVSPSTYADSATWDGSEDTSWTTPDNWTGGGVPGGSSTSSSTDIATFSTPTAARIITVDSERNVSGITFSGSGNFNTTLTGGSLWLTSGGTIQNFGNSGTRTDKIESALVIQGDGGTYAIGANSTNNAAVLQITTGGITGVSTAGNTTTLTLTGGNNSAGNSVSAVIGDGSAGGNVAVVKSGNGWWSLSGANTYSGGFTLDAGNVRISNASAFGTGTLTINGGALSGSGSSTIANDMVWNATVAHNNLIGNSGSIVMNGDALLTGNRDVNVTAVASSLTVNGVISDGGGSFGINKMGVFGLTLGGANTYTGTTNVNAGTLTLGAAGSLANTSTLAVNAGNAVGTAGGRVNLNGRSQTVAALTGGSGAGGQGIIANASNTAATLTVDGSGDSTYDGLLVEAGAAGALSLAKAGSGTLTLTGSHSYAGGTTVNGGTLLVNGGATNAAGSSSVLGVGSNGFGQFTMSGVPDVGSLVVGQRVSGLHIPDYAYITSINTATNTITFSAYFNTRNTAAETETFAAYTGSGLGTGAVTVFGGTLGGTGVIAGATTIESGGTLAAGANGVGTLTFGSSLELAGTTLLEIANASSFDVIAANSIAYGGTLTINLLGGFTLSGGESYELFTSTTKTGDFTSISVVGTTLDSSNDYTATIGGLTYTFVASDTGGVLSVAAVPEPSTYAAIMGAITLAGVAIRRLRRAS